MDVNVHKRILFKKSDLWIIKHISFLKALAVYETISLRNDDEFVQEQTRLLYGTLDINN